MSEIWNTYVNFLQFVISPAFLAGWMLGLITLFVYLTRQPKTKTPVN